MGWEGVRWELHATLDAHAGDAERRDTALWEELTTALDAVLALPQYQRSMVTVIPPAPEDIPPAVRARALLALVEAASRLAGRDPIGEYVDVGDVSDALAECVDQLQWHAFEQVGDAARGRSVRVVDGHAVTISDWLQAHGRERVK